MNEKRHSLHANRREVRTGADIGWAHMTTGNSQIGVERTDREPLPVAVCKRSGRRRGLRHGQAKLVEAVLIEHTGKSFFKSIYMNQLLEAENATEIDDRGAPVHSVEVGGDLGSICDLAEALSVQLHDRILDLNRGQLISSAFRF